MPLVLRIVSCNMDILPASLRDLSALRRVEHVCFPKDAWPLLDLLAVLTWPDVVRLKAVIDNNMVGFIAGDPRPSDNLAWIATVGVLPEYQHRGIGKALLLACEEKLPQARLRLCVRASNQHAIQLYQHIGYMIIETWKEYYNDKENAFLMEKVR